MAEDLYTCAMCLGTFLKGWTDDEARAEYETNMPRAAERKDEEVIVCDYCYPDVLAWTKSQGLEL